MAWLQDLFGKKTAAVKAGMPLDSPAPAPGADVACSFCGLPRTSVKYLISAPRNIFICETCVADCVGVLENQGSHDPVESTRDFVLRQLRSLEKPADLSTSRRLVEAALALAAGLDRTLALLEPHVAVAPDGQAWALLCEVHASRGHRSEALAARARALEAIHPESALASKLRSQDL